LASQRVITELVSQARQRRWMPIRANTCATPSSTLRPQAEKHRGQIEYGRGFALLDGVEDRPVPDIDADWNRH